MALAIAGSVQAQSPDSVRAGPAGVPVQRDGSGGFGESISPRRAFISSLLAPGYGQARLDRPFGAALFAAVEVGAILMTRKSLNDLRIAKRFRYDSIVARYEIDESGNAVRDSSGNLIVAEYVPNTYTPELVQARRLHLEDWIALLAFNHIIAGADAFVAAQLRDVPGDLSTSMTRDGVSIAARFAW